ncbi:MAG: apolipoprotein N-acyltransferase [Acidimicrobiia bacterium]
MAALLLVLAGAVVSVIAFPPFGPGWLILIGAALSLTGFRQVSGRAHGLVAGSVHGLVFFGGLIWWIGELGLIAVVPLVIFQALYHSFYGWWLGRYHDLPGERWLLLAVGGWGLMELIRYHIPLIGMEWGALGYALSDQPWARYAAPVIGTSGITMLVVAVGGLVALEVTRKSSGRTRAFVLLPLLVVGGAASTRFFEAYSFGPGVPVAIVQGSTPCPFEHCPPNERLRTFRQHLELTRTIEPGSVDLVVWSEGSTGSVNADPVQNPEVGVAIAAEARRIGAWFLIGSDRTLSDTDWVNANVVFSPEGEIVGEYRKQHPVPFGEYIPFRPLFTWIPDLERVPRDMIPGEGPVVFDFDGYELGSVISFEGGFSRYPRQHALAGANVIVVATNEGSYGLTPGSDQFIGMTRMRAAELRLPVVHAAVTGKSVVIDFEGGFQSEMSGLGTQEVVFGEFTPRTRSAYAVTGDVVMTAAGVIGLLIWWRARALVVSPAPPDEEE